MRLSSLMVAVILFSSSAVFSQHSSSGGAPSSPPSSPAPAAAPSSPPPSPASSPSPSVSSSAASSAASSASVSHSTPSSPSPVSSASHAETMPSPSASHVSGSSSTHGGEARTASPVRPPNSGNEGSIVGSPRIGEVQPTKEIREKEKGSKVPEPDLRRRICTNGACKEPEPNPGEADLRRRICPNGSCKECPPGQSAGKNGNCVTTPAPPRTASACQANESWNGSICTGAASACQPNEYWNGNACMAGNRCQAGESWNGFECANPGQCATFSSRAGLLAEEARSIRRDMEAACSKDPYGQECMRLTQSHDGAVLRYEMLLNEAPVSCRTMLPDPLTL